MNFLENNTDVSENVAELILPRYPWLGAGLSERYHGNMRLGQNGQPMNPMARARFAMELGVPPERVIAPTLVHGGEARTVTRRDLEQTFEVDGLVTREPNLFVSVTVADCVPVFFVDTAQKIVGLAHAGWRGILRGVLISVIEEMKKMGSAPENIFVGVGPSIGACHFEVGVEVAEQFQSFLGRDVVSRREEKLFVDLKKSVVRLVGRAGVLPDHIRTNESCTYCEERYFSHRRDAATAGAQAMMAVIGIIE